MRLPLTLTFTGLAAMVLSSTVHMSGCAQGKASLPQERERLSLVFADPPADYRSTPLWVWNDTMTEEQIEVQLTDFKAQGIGGVFIHPRPGLITPYLSDEWFSLCRHAVAVGKRLGMKVWLYDENSYPSGFAGGHVPAEMPDAVKKGLYMDTVDNLEGITDAHVVLRKGPAGYEDVTAQLESLRPTKGVYRVFRLVSRKPSPWFGGFSYVDLLRRDVTEKFLDVTMNAYRRAIGSAFGETVPGVFQDEAEISPPGDAGPTVIQYTPALFDEFSKRWGYSLQPRLPSLYADEGDWRKTRHDYYSTLLDLFIEGWAKPYFDYCTKTDLHLTGHYWEHEWPIPRLNPDNMACAAYAHMPGIDVLMNNFRTDTHGQFGNVRAVKEIRSIANQLGYERTLSETFGAGGWEMTFFDQKRIADWEYALGVNFLNQHLSYVTITGARKRDHPLSFSYHEPWWGSYKTLADYYGRLTVALSAGEQRNRILVLEPTTTAWMLFAPRGSADALTAVGKRFQDFLNGLEARQVEYDLGSEHTLRLHGRVEGKAFVVGKRHYETVVLPPALENLDQITLTLLERYLQAGGKVICHDTPPSYCDGKADKRAGELAAQYHENWIASGGERMFDLLRSTTAVHIEFRGTDRTAGIFPLLFHHRRILDDGELLFLANTDSINTSTGNVLLDGKSCQRWDLFTGQVESYPATPEGGRISVDFSIPPGGSLLLCTGRDEKPSPTIRKTTTIDMPSTGEMAVTRLEPNVYTLDYCDVKADTLERKNIYFYSAQQLVYQAHGWARNPWDGGVQFKSELVDKDRFDAKSGFVASFHFTVNDGVERSTLQAVVERPWLFEVAVNGHVVAPLRGRHWLDRAFGLFDIGSRVTPGPNTLEVRSAPFTLQSELEPVYLLGDFSLVPGTAGFTIGQGTKMQKGGWNGMGMPFYPGCVRYEKRFTLSDEALKSGTFEVSLPKWRGVTATIVVNDRPVGIIAFAPFTRDVTDHLKAGENTICVDVFGSLKNTLGPHHNGPGLGSAWPGMFQRGAAGGVPPGSKYFVLEYGLFEDFQLLLHRTAE